MSLQNGVLAWSLPRTTRVVVVDGIDGGTVVVLPDAVLSPDPLLQAVRLRRAAMPAVTTSRRMWSNLAAVAGQSRFVEGLGQRVPRQGGALDPHRELDHAPQRLKLAHVDARRGGVARFGLHVGPVQAPLVDGHHGLEGPD